MLALHIPVSSKSLDTKAAKMIFDLDNEILISGLLTNANALKLREEMKNGERGLLSIFKENVENHSDRSFSLFR